MHSYIIEKYAYLNLTKYELESFIERVAIANEEVALSDLIKGRVRRDKLTQLPLILLGVTGSRTFNDINFLYDKLDSYNVAHIISGGAHNVDSMVANYGVDRGIPVDIEQPNFEKYGKGAIFKKNNNFIFVCDEVVVFWDGKSRGTRILIEQMSKYKAKYKIIKF